MNRSSEVRGVWEVRRLPRGRHRATARPTRLRSEVPPAQVLPGSSRAVLLDLALRALAGSAQERGCRVPDIVSVRVDDDRVVVHLAGAALSRPAPWVVGDDVGSWSARGIDLAPLAGCPPAPWPLLVTVERGPSHDLLIDLATAPGLVTVGGDAGLAGEVALAMILELMIHPRSASVEAVLVGFGARWAGLGARRVRGVGDLDSLLAQHGDVRRPTVSVLTELGVYGVLHGRRPDATCLAHARPAAGPPRVILLAAPPSPAQARRLADLTSGDPARWSVVCVGDSPAARWRFVVDAWGQLHFPAAGIGGEAARGDRAPLDASGKRREVGLTPVRTGKTRRQALPLGESGNRRRTSWQT